MTTPSNSPDSPVEATPTADLPPGSAAAPPTYPPATPPAAPFAPVERAPRTPWVNPARRGHLAAAAVVGALIFGGGGMLIGHAVTGHNEHRSGVQRMERPGVAQQGPRPAPRQQRQGGPRRQIPNQPPAPAPAPSGSATG